ncbi:GPR1/FUN34/yaaH family-domain-containing protein [Xylogone sp. PMI_703]|nr:GPR1/FUN34/yaaH family-domain-containing protein [Xylogone sp. PMI_703]
MTKELQSSDLERQVTSVTLSPRDQIALPYVKRNFANPAPLAFIAFGTSVFLVSVTGIHARGVKHDNIIVPALIVYGGLCQVIAGIMEFVAGNTFGATAFKTYGAFNAAYGMLFLPGTGVLTAYTDLTTNELSNEFYQALSLFAWPWFIITVLLTVAVIRSSWALLILFVFPDFLHMFLALDMMLVDNHSVNMALAVLGFTVVLLSCIFSFKPLVIS